MIGKSAPPACLIVVSLAFWSILSFACESKPCREITDNDPEKNLAFHNICIFGVDVYGEPVRQIESLYPACDFYVNTNSLCYVKTYAEGEIIARKLNARLNEQVYEVRVKDTAAQEREGWVRKKSVPTLLEIYHAKEDNGIDSAVVAALAVKREKELSTIEIVFKNNGQGERFVFFKPLESGPPFSPPVEIRDSRSGRAVAARIELDSRSSAERGFLSETVLFKRLAGQQEWRLSLRLKIDVSLENEKQFLAVVNYTVRKDPELGTYWTCSSPFQLF